MNLKSHQQALIVAGIVSAVLTLIPFAHDLLLPLVYLNTHLHEMCHAFTALAFGGQVVNITVHADGSGLTPLYTPSGLAVLFVSSAGYVGAALIGAAMVVVGKTPKSARNVLWSIAAVLALSLLIWVRGDLVGIVSAVFWIGILAALGRYANDAWALFSVQFLGLQQCLNAFNSLYSLLQVSAFTEGQSDAMNMQQASGIPALFWALAWAAFSLVMVFLAFRQSWRRGGSLRPGR